MRVTKAKAILGMALLAVAGCGEAAPDQIDNILKLKILAIRAERPDLLPGETTQIKILAAAPNATSMTTFVVPFAQTVASDFGEGRADFGSAGTAYGYAPGSTIPVPPIDLGVRLGGESAPNFGVAYYQAPATPGSYTLGAFVREGTPSISLHSTAAELDAQLQAEMNRALKAIKTIRVKPKGETLNENPRITALVPEKRWRKLSDTGGLESPIAPAGFVVRPKEIIRVRVDFEDEKPERPSTVWWKTGGDFYGYGRNDADWVAPEKADIHTLIAVNLDREGGVDWFFQDVAVSPAKAPLEARSAGAGVAQSVLLARSNGRMLWLGFADPVSAAAVEKALSGGKPVVVAGTLQADPVARLGWYLDAPALVGFAADLTDSVVTANDINSVRQKQPVLMRFDELILPVGMKAFRQPK